MQETPTLDEPLPLNSCALHRNFQDVHFLDTLKKLRRDLYNWKQAYERQVWTSNTRWEINSYTLKSYDSILSKRTLAFHHIESYSEQNTITTHNVHTSGKILKDLNSSYDTSELIDDVFDDDPLCIDYDDTSIMFDNEFYNSVELGDYYHPSRSKSDFEQSNHKPISSQFQSFDKFLIYSMFLILEKMCFFEVIHRQIKLLSVF